jgi:hypothetical protein
MNDLIVFSALFGDAFDKLYPAPLKDNCFLFTNNKKLQLECKNKGWHYVYLDVLISESVTDAYQYSSLQSKYVKFLEVKKDFPELFKNKKYGLYFDHKFEVKKSHIETFLQIQNNGLVIRTTPKIKNTVYDEIEDAMGQQRYRNRMTELKDWIKTKVAEGYSVENRICNTGLMLYDMQNKNIINLCSKIYLATMQVLNPECQVIWAILSQQYTNNIKTIPFDEIAIKWENPTN